MTGPTPSTWIEPTDLELTRPGVRFDITAVVPIHGDAQALCAFVSRLTAQQVSCVLVDDGSEPQSAAVLDGLIREHPRHVRLLRLLRNQGKNAAMVAGMREARRLGHTHALQVDTVGRHDINDVLALVALSSRNADAVICGAAPVDASRPEAHGQDRRAPFGWLGMLTLSKDLRRPTRGLRIYPLTSTIALLNRAKLGAPMDVDTEILVRLHWQGVRVVNHPLQGVASSQSESQPRSWRERISTARTHARLFFGMLLRLPHLVARNVRR